MGSADRTSIAQEPGKHVKLDEQATWSSADNVSLILIAATPYAGRMLREWGATRPMLCASHKGDTRAGASRLEPLGIALAMPAHSMGDGARVGANKMKLLCDDAWAFGSSLSSTSLSFNLVLMLPRHSLYIRSLSERPTTSR